MNIPFIMQLHQFGEMRWSHVSFIDTSRVTFENLYLRNWSAERETIPYPPNIGEFAIYRQLEFYESVDYTLKKVINEMISIHIKKWSSLG